VQRLSRPLRRATVFAAKILVGLVIVVVPARLTERVRSLLERARAEALCRAEVTVEALPATAIL
jgi:hypothetical protein